VVDLDTERAESVASVQLPGRFVLEGALSNGNVVIRVVSPEPAILVYRIVVEN